MNVKEHLIYYQRCLQNTTQIVLRLRMTDLNYDVRMLLSLERSNGTVVIEQWSFLPFESSIYTWRKMMTVAEREVPAGIYSYNCDSCSYLLW